MNTDDLYNLFVDMDMPGVRKEVVRLAKGVNKGDAGVMNELLQAAYDPSAGQQALQAGEQVQQPCLAFDQQALVSAIATSVGSAMVSSMSTYLVKQDAREAAMSTYLVKQDAKETAFHDSLNTLVVAIKENHDVVQQNLHIMDEKLADADAMNAENKADTDAKMAEIMNALSKVATGSAPDDPANLPMRKNQRYTAESKRITLQWLLKHISNPYPNRDEMECLQNKTGVDTIKRMTSLVNQIRIKEMVKDKKNKNGKWCRRTTTKPLVLGNKHSWSLKSISDCM